MIQYWQGIMKCQKTAAYLCFELSSNVKKFLLFKLKLIWGNKLGKNVLKSSRQCYKETLHFIN